MSAIHGLSHTAVVKVQSNLKPPPKPAAKPDVVAPPKVQTSSVQNVTTTAKTSGVNKTV